jgi:hypothetical protein
MQSNICSCSTERRFARIRCSVDGGRRHRPHNVILLAVLDEAQHPVAGALFGPDERNERGVSFPIAELELEGAMRGRPAG